MLKRKPTRIELDAEDKEELAEAKKRAAAAAPPPPPSSSTKTLPTAMQILPNLKLSTSQRLGLTKSHD
ncbi:hypothetical protein KP509_08G010900 [Ceratopteris richardii]|uniref:Uncharacterized protein n=1 Tax=Ceratopteris richardii TaxID=49495 RepID=A0A8T2U5U8_CERRI|nr:hypothetical protein KP509_08G010900 [Ceratopteris richardii]